MYCRHADQRKQKFLKMVPLVSGLYDLCNITPNISMSDRNLMQIIKHFKKLSVL